MWTYEKLKKWRNKSKKNAKYNANYMKVRRQAYSLLYKRGDIAYEDIPKSYRTMNKKDLSTKS